MNRQLITLPNQDLNEEVDLVVQPFACISDKDKKELSFDFWNGFEVERVKCSIPRQGMMEDISLFLKAEERLDYFRSKKWKVFVSFWLIF